MGVKPSQQIFSFLLDHIARSRLRWPLVPVDPL
jgi:hypothetical protein